MIQIKRGLKSNLPTLQSGEPGFCTDTKEFFIGDGTTNHQFVNDNDIRLTNNRNPTAHNHSANEITSDTLSVDRIPNLDAAKITSGTINISRIPAAALERLVTVSNQTARYALTTTNVQTGDTVKQSDTNVMYRVIDDTNLNNSSGYTEYVAGRAAAVSWSGIENIPSSFTPSSHTHGGISNDGKIGTTSGLIIVTGTNGTLEAKSAGTTSQFLRGDGTWQSVSSGISDVIAVDNILDGSNVGAEITYAPYSTNESANLKFYTHATNPSGTSRLNIGAYFYATRLYDDGVRVLNQNSVIDGGSFT